MSGQADGTDTASLPGAEERSEGAVGGVGGSEPGTEALVDPALSGAGGCLAAPHAALALLLLPELPVLLPIRLPVVAVFPVLPAVLPFGREPSAWLFTFLVEACTRDTRTDRQSAGRTSRKTDRQTDRQMDGWTDM